MTDSAHASRRWHAKPAQLARQVGPFRGGWATAVAGHPDKVTTFYFGSADGGVWKTDNAGVTYGQFALVLGLVTWLSFLAIATLMSCEFNAALTRRRSNVASGA